MHVFRTTNYSGSEPKASEEMNPRWFPKPALPYNAMWAADRIWIPRALEGLSIPKSIVFNADGSDILSID